MALGELGQEDCKVEAWTVIGKLGRENLLQASHTKNWIYAVRYKEKGANRDKEYEGVVIFKWSGKEGPTIVDHTKVNRGEGVRH